MTTKAEALSAIYGRLTEVPTFHPANADLFTDWTIQGGDIIVVNSGNVPYGMPVYSSQVNWFGKTTVTVQSSGGEQYPSIEEMAQQKNSQAGNSYRRSIAASSFDQEIHHAIYSEDGYLHAFVDITASYIRTEMADDVSGLHSEIEQTASSIRMEVADTANGLHSEIVATASSIRQEVSDSDNSLRGSITTQANRIDLVVEGTGSNAHIKPASIVAAINNGASSIKISADHITLDGDTIVGLLEGKQIGADSFMGETFYLIGGGQLILGADSTIGSADSAGLIVDASVSGNTLTLTRYDGDTVTFSRATSLSGAWSGRTYTVTASPQGDTRSDTVYVYPKANAGGDMSIMPVYVSHTDASDQNMLSDTVERFYLVEDVSGKKVNLKKGSADGSVYAYVSTSSTHTAGYNSAHVTSSWSDNALTYSKTTSGSANSGTVYVGCAVGQLQGYTGYYTYANYWTTGSATAIPSTRKQLTIVNNGKNAVKLQVAGSDSGLSYTHSQYNNGWTAAYGKVSVPTSSNTGGSISIGVPPSTVDGTTATYTYSVSADNSYAYIKYGNTTVARVSNGAYNNGYNAGYGAARISGSWSNNVYTGTISTSGGTSTSITVTATASISYNSSTHNYTATGGAVAGGSTRHTATATSGTEAYEAGRASGMAEAHNSVYWGINTSSEVYRPNTTLSGYEVWFNILTVTENGGYVLRSQYNTDTSISNFSTTAPAGATHDGITNGSDGYYLSGSGSSATAIIVTKSTWDQGSLSRTEYDSLAAAPTALYRKGYSDGQSAGGSYTRYTFYKTRTQDSSGYHYTFAIGTGWTATFGSGDGNYYLYKKN